MQRVYTEDSIKKVLQYCIENQDNLIENSRSKYATKDILNKRVDGTKLTILAFAPSRCTYENAPTYICKCDCGRLTLGSCKNIVKGNIKSCGFCNTRVYSGRPITSIYSQNDWIGLRVGTDTIVASRKIEDSSQIEFDVQCNICKEHRGVKASNFCSGYENQCQCCKSVVNKARKIMMLKSDKDLSIRYLRDYDSHIIEEFSVQGIQMYRMCCDKCFKQYVHRADEIDAMTQRFKECQCKRVRADRGIIPKAGQRISQSVDLLKMIGTKHGKLIVKRLVWRGQISDSSFICDCDCGQKDVEMQAYGIKNWKTSQCGKCLEAPNKKYGDPKYIGKLYWNNLLTLSSYSSNGKTYFVCACMNCGNVGVSLPAVGVLSGNNKQCGCMLQYGEVVIDKVLNESRVRYRRQANFPDLLGVGGGRLRFDFMLYDLQDKPVIAVEYDGKQHAIPKSFQSNEGVEEVLKRFEIINKHDKIKDDYCKQHNIEMFRLSGTVSISDVDKIIVKYNNIIKGD